MAVEVAVERVMVRARVRSVAVAVMVAVTAVGLLAPSQRYSTIEGEEECRL